MKVLHLARKPLKKDSVVTNILEHGTGALNIAACRIGENPLFQHGRADDPFFRYTSPEERNERVWEGRWPTNLILEHLPDCCCTGTKKINSRGRDRKPGKEDEVIEVWDCVPGCPVAELDACSGQSAHLFKQLKG